MRCQCSPQGGHALFDMGQAAPFRLADAGSEPTGCRCSVLRAPSALRVGEVRVFYDISGTTVEVLAIVAKSEADAAG